MGRESSTEVIVEMSRESPFFFRCKSTKRSKLVPEQALGTDIFVPEPESTN